MMRRSFDSTVRRSGAMRSARSIEPPARMMTAAVIATGGREPSIQVELKGSTLNSAPMDPVNAALRAIPSVDRILSATSFAPLIEEFGRERVKDAVAEYLNTIRTARAAYDEREAAAAVADAIASATRSTLRRVINGSGVIIHTNLGRSPIHPSIWADAAQIVAGYSNLEFDLEEGSRGARDEHLTQICRTLFGCEAAVLTNNNAAGTMLVLAAVAAGEGRNVSRGGVVGDGGAVCGAGGLPQGGAGF